MRLFLLPLLCGALFAQAPPAAPDVMVLSDGERLVGRFIRSTAGSVRFKSDLVGEVSVKWDKVKELHSARRFAVVTKGGERIADGPLEVLDQKIVTNSGSPVAPTDTAHVIDEKVYEEAFVRNPGILRGWRGTATLGASIVSATQNSRTFTDAVSLTRSIPGEEWLPARNRTTLDFSSSYGILTQPSTPKVKTSILHADAERDEYFSKSAFAFAQMQFDHNFSQGLDLQQTYSGGLGWSAIKRTSETLDVKAGMSFVRQQFAAAAAQQDLASGIFEEKFLRHFGKGALFTEHASASPSWNNTEAFSASAGASLAIPVYRKFTFTVGTMDNFLNDPPPGFKKNSVQLSTGLTYVLH